jgi:hypothetical protein
MRTVLPRLLRAAFYGFLMGGEALLALRLTGLNETVAALLPVGGSTVVGFMVVFMIFEVAIQLLSSTIFPYALRVTRTILSMLYLVFVTRGGVVTLAIPPEIIPLGTMPIQLTLEFQAVVAVLLIVSLLSIAKNVMQGISFLSERAEHPRTLPELP